MKRQSATSGKRPLRAFSVIEKINAIQRVNDGASKASVSRDTGVPESTLRGWCKSEHKIRRMADFEASSGTSNLSSEDGPLLKKMKIEQAVSCSTNKNIDRGETNKIESSLNWNYLSNLMSIISGTRPENSALLRQQHGILPTATGSNLGGSLTGNLEAKPDLGAEAALTPVPASPRKIDETHSTNAHHGSSFWQWYKNQYPQNTTHCSKRAPGKSRALIDSIVSQNNNNNESFKRSFHLTDDDVGLTTYEEAIIHGETFFKWLDNCSDPSVSRVQIMQLKCLVDGLKCKKMPSSGVKRSRK